MLWQIDYQQYDITVATVLSYSEKDVASFPTSVHVMRIPLPQQYSYIFNGKKKTVISWIVHGDIKTIVKYGKNLFCYKRPGTATETYNLYKNIIDYFPEMNIKYDLAVDFYGNQDFTTFYVANKVNASKKVSWLHGMFSCDLLKLWGTVYSKYDYMVGVSKAVKERFDESCPQNNNCKVIYNIISAKDLYKKCEQGDTFLDSFSGIRIVTVGRLSIEKGPDMAISVLKRLRSDGFDVRWYWIGGESSKSFLEQILALLGTEDCRNNFIIMGHKSNPYGYMKNCDIYVQPSYTEGYCTATNEAKILGCCVIRTDTPGAKEQFTHGETGSIVPIDENALYQEIKKLIEHPEIRERYKNGLTNLNVNNSNEIQKLYDMMG